MLVAGILSAAVPENDQEGDRRDCRTGFRRTTRRNTERNSWSGPKSPIDGTLFGYGLDIQRCIGCRRCVYGCVEENNLSRDPQIQYIRVLRFKDGNMDLEAIRHLLRSGRGAGEGLLLHAGAVPALRQRALHQGVPCAGHMDRAGRDCGGRLQLVHRMPLLHGRVPVHGPMVQFHRPWYSQAIR